MLTEAGKYGKLYFVQSEKQSRVSTLTIAQARDYGLITKNFLSDFPKWFYWLSGGYDIHSFFCVSHRKPEGIHLTEVYDN